MGPRCSLTRRSGCGNAEWNPLGGETRYGYDARGNRTSVRDANGNSTTFEYDRANRLVAEVNPIGGVTRYEYDLAGNRLAKVDGNGLRTVYGYDANRRLREVLFADGSAYAYDYDLRGNRTLERSGAHERGLDYDALGRLVRVDDRTLGRTIQYGYDASGNRTRMELDTGEVVTYRWDLAGRLAEVSDPDGESTRFEYDAAGRRERVSYGNGTVAAWGYDAAGQVKSVVYANRAGEVQTGFGYAYDAAGNRKWKAFADGRREGYGYDGLNRLVEVDYPGGRHVEYAYDGVGNRVSLIDTGKAPVTRWAVSAKASSYHTSMGGSAAGVTGPPDQAGCERNARPQAWWPAAPAREEWLEVEFGEAERASGIRVHETNSTPFVMRIDLIDEGGGEHTVYEGGDRTACGDWLDVRFERTAYRVKAARIVTRTTGTGAGGYAGVDAVGLSVVPRDRYAYNGFNQLESVTGNDGATTTFGYDDNGNQVRKTVTPAGGAAQFTEYVYDLDNRLVGIALPGGATNAFEYDANGLRTKKTDSAGTTRYLLDGQSIAAEYGAGRERQAWYTQSLARIDEVLSVANGQGKFWYQADALGSVYALTTASGEVRARGGYDVFGAAVAEGGQSVGQPFGFTGREHDLDSALVYARQRYLSPALGAWIQPDRLGDSDGPNRYLFVQARPVLFVDPRGERTEVVMFHPVGHGSSSFGHIAVRIDDDAFSFGPTGMGTPKFRSYMDQNAFRDGIGIVLDLTPAEEQALRFYLTEFGSKYNAIIPNCVYPAQRGVAAAIRTEIQATIWPHELMISLAASPRAVAETYYPATRQPQANFVDKVEDFLLPNWGQDIWEMLLNAGVL